jgi:hypothetical protein
MKPQELKVFSALSLCNLQCKDMEVEARGNVDNDFQVEDFIKV